MKSNVILKGSGKGTGLRNNTANAYEVQFIGTTPTYYGIAAPAGVNITTDAAGDAANFSKDDFIILKDDTSTTIIYGYAAQAKADGVGGSGVVACYTSPDREGLAASGEAAPLTGAVDKAGLSYMDVVNTSSGSIEIKIQYATRSIFENCYIDEVLTTIDQSLYTNFKDCEFTATNTTAHDIHINLLTYVCETDIENCKFANANYGINWDNTDINGMSGLNYINCFNSCWRGIYLFPSVTKVCRIEGINISDSVFHTGWKPDGTAGGIGFFIRSYGSHISIQDNIWPKFASTGISIHFDLQSVSYLYARCNIVGNQAQGGMDFENVQSSSISGNYNVGFLIFDGYQFCSVAGNEASGVFIRDQNIRQVKSMTFSGNQVDAVSLAGDVTYPMIDCVFSGNKITMFTATTHMNTCIFDGNIFDGNVTFTDGGANTMDDNVFTNNNVTGNVSWSNADQDDCVVKNNLISGALTRLTGEGNKTDFEDRIAKSGNYQTLGEDVIGCTAGGITITLATADLVNGRTIYVKDEGANATASPITIDTQGAETIDGAASIQITVDYGIAKIYSDGTNWFTL